MSDVHPTRWIEACSIDDIEKEDLIRFDHNGRTYAIYRSPDNTFHATDGLCTHEQAHLKDAWLWTTSSNVPNTTVGSITAAVKDRAHLFART